MLLGPVSGATPGGVSPILAFAGGGFVIVFVWTVYFRREIGARPSTRYMVAATLFGVFFIALGIWHLLFPR